jgi:protein SCO1/2
LQQYAISNDIHSKNWHLLTGSKSIIYTLARTSYFAEEDLGFTKDSTQFLHTEHIILVDKNKRIRGVYNGTLQLETEQMVKDIQMLMEEKE